MTRDNTITGTINGDEFEIKTIGVDQEYETHEMAKEYTWEHFPDEYGGITIPVPVDPSDTETVVTHHGYDGRLVAGAGFPFETVVPGDHVEIDVSGCEYINRINDGVVTDMEVAYDDAGASLDVEIRFTDFEKPEAAK